MVLDPPTQLVELAHKMVWILSHYRFNSVMELKKDPVGKDLGLEICRSRNQY